VSSDWIEIDPVLRGTRIAVHSVLEMLAAGDSVEDVLEALPSRTISRMRRGNVEFGAEKLVLSTGRNSTKFPHLC